jgi:hypothetical protein
MESYKLIICIYACVTIDKYKEQIKKINGTYGNDCNESVKIIYFLGEEKCDEFVGDQYVYLPNVSNDYLSASYKQYLGLKYIYENYRPEFVLCCGTDTFINIPKLMPFLNKLNSADNLYIGGHGCSRKIGDRSYYFHSGGPGFIITYPCLKQICPFLPNMVESWIHICRVNNIEQLIPSCDVAISYFLQKHVFPEIIKTDGLSFIHCNHRGTPCHIGEIIMKDIISCHSMSLFDFDDFYNILSKNNHFM